MKKIETKTYKPGDERKYAHMKIDGHYTTVKKTNFGAMIVLSSSMIDITAKVRHFAWLQTLSERMPNGQTIAGELYVEGKQASAVASYPDNTKFCGFALPLHPADLSCLRVNALLTRWGCETVDVYQLNVAYMRVSKFVKSPWNFPGFEGVVFKDGNMLNWCKWKPVRTIDLLIGPEYVDGKNANLGLVGSLRMFAKDGIEVATAGGMNKETRLDMSLNWPKYSGRICEVKYQNVGAKGRLRHPRFARMRPDKEFARCGIDQDADLQRFWCERVHEDQFVCMREQLSRYPYGKGGEPC